MRSPIGKRVQFALPLIVIAVIALSGCIEEERAGSLGADSSMPMALLTIKGNFDFDADVILVRFFNESGYDVNIPISSRAENSIIVAVPPYIDLSTGNFSSGTVNVQVIKSSNGTLKPYNTLRGFRIEELPELNAAPGEITLGFLKSALNASKGLQENIGGTELDTAEVRATLEEQEALADKLIKMIEEAMASPSKEIPFGSTKDINVMLDETALRNSDRMLLAMAIAMIGSKGRAESAEVKSKIEAGAEADIIMFADGSDCAPQQARSFSYSVEYGKPDLFMGYHGGGQITPVLCKVAVSTNTAAAVVGGSASIGLGVAGLIGAALGASTLGVAAHVSAQLIYVNGALGIGYIAIAKKLSNVAQGTKELAQEGMQRIREARDVYLSFMAQAVLEFYHYPTWPLDLYEIWEGSHRINTAIERMEQYKKQQFILDLEQPIVVNGFSISSISPSIGASVLKTCMNKCTVAFREGTKVKLDPVDAKGAKFTGWSGACSGKGPCELTMDSDKKVNANYEPDTRLLTVFYSGNGTGNIYWSSLLSYDCRTVDSVYRCSAPQGYGNTVTLTALPESGSEFAGWSGACSGLGSCTVLIDSDKDVTANFNLKETQEPGGTTTPTEPPGGTTTEPGGGITGTGTTQTSQVETKVALSSSSCGKGEVVQRVWQGGDQYANIYKWTLSANGTAQGPEGTEIASYGFDLVMQCSSWSGNGDGHGCIRQQGQAESTTWAFSYSWNYGESSPYDQPISITASSSTLAYQDLLVGFARCG